VVSEYATVYYIVMITALEAADFEEKMPADVPASRS
jgi:hypothetical protein